jgi:formylglycine-generating enzyme required for sulfatase activity
MVKNDRSRKSYGIISIVISLIIIDSLSGWLVSIPIEFFRGFFLDDFRIAAVGGKGSGYFPYDYILIYLVVLAFLYFGHDLLLRGFGKVLFATDKELIAFKISSAKGNQRSEWLKVFLKMRSTVFIAVLFGFVSLTHPGEYREIFVKGKSVEVASIKDCEECPELVLVKGGSFVMGSENKNDNAPLHEVAINYDVYVGKYEVSENQYRECIEDDVCDHHGGLHSKSFNFSLGGVSRKQASRYVEWLSAKTAYTYRLPSESEWEYFSGSPNKMNYWWGDVYSTSLANCGNCVSKKKNNRKGFNPKVFTYGLFYPNHNGLYDVVGNSAEWVSDCWSEKYKDVPSDGKPWLGSATNCSSYITRGGSALDDKRYLRSYARHRRETDEHKGIGLRVVREISNN